MRQNSAQEPKPQSSRRALRSNDQGRVPTPLRLLRTKTSPIRDLRVHDSLQQRAIPSGSRRNTHQPHQPHRRQRQRRKWRRPMSLKTRQIAQLLLSRRRLGRIGEFLYITGFEPGRRPNQDGPLQSFQPTASRLVPSQTVLYRTAWQQLAAHQEGQPSPPIMHCQSYGLNSEQ